MLTIFSEIRLSLYSCNKKVSFCWVSSFGLPHMNPLTFQWTPNQWFGIDRDIRYLSFFSVLFLCKMVPTLTSGFPFISVFLSSSVILLQIPPHFYWFCFLFSFNVFSPQLFLACVSVLVNLSIYYHHDFLITSGTPFYVVVVVKSEPNKNRNSNFSTKIKQIDILLE